MSANHSDVRDALHITVLGSFPVALIDLLSQNQVNGERVCFNSQLQGLCLGGALKQLATCSP